MVSLGDDSALKIDSVFKNMSVEQFVQNNKTQSFDALVADGDFRTHTVEGLASRQDARYL